MDGTVKIKGAAVAGAIAGALIDSVLIGAVAWDWGRISDYVIGVLYIAFYLMLATCIVILYISAKTGKQKRLPYTAFVICVIHFIMYIGTLSLYSRTLRWEIYKIINVTGLIISAVAILCFGVYVLMHNQAYKENMSGNCIRRKRGLKKSGA